MSTSHLSGLGFEHSFDGEVTKQYFNCNSGVRTNTNTVLCAALKNQYPSLKLTVVSSYNADIFTYAANGFATITPVQDSSVDVPTELRETVYVPPTRRAHDSPGFVVAGYSFGKFIYKWKDHEFIVYLADTFAQPYMDDNKYYILSTDQGKANALVEAAGQWNSQLHQEIWVFDGGSWDKNRELYASVMKASWDVVILDPDMKKALIDDHLSFFRSESTYKRLKVPWKRGVIYHGPPGNGKTISIKAMMHMLYSQKSEIPTLYVRSLQSFMGPEESIKRIFKQARRYAPCYLVFEDLDSIVSDDVRSYFLNEVDGLQSNDGIFMVGSTNHLDRLDPGISKRPSRFDRKYFFPDPNFDERVAYSHFWQSKLKDNKAIDFPNKLCSAIAEITHGFSFAYMQEAFVAALLAIARSGRPDDLAEDLHVLTVDVHDDWVSVIGNNNSDDDDDKGLDRLLLWVEIQKQIEILRQGMDQEPEE